MPARDGFFKLLAVADVEVRVDEAREKRPSGSVDDGCVGRGVEAGAELVDPDRAGEQLRARAGGVKGRGASGHGTAAAPGGMVLP